NFFRKSITLIPPNSDPACGEQSMKKNHPETTVSVRRSLFVFLLVAASLGAAAIAPIVSRSWAQSVAPATTSATGAATAKDPKLVYPESRKGDQVDDYFGTKVADPYRWLEDDRSPEVAAWVEAQNKVTFAYLDQIPYRAAVKDRLVKLFNYLKYGAPQRRGEWFISSKNDGLQNQSVMYIHKGLDGKQEVLLDPNKFSADGTSGLRGPQWSSKGKYLLYGISKGGSDWNDVYVFDVATKKTLTDHLTFIKNGTGSWLGEDGFFYSRYPEPEKGKELYNQNEFQKVYYHKVGTAQSDDVLIYEDTANAQRFHSVGVTEDERYAILYVSERGKGKDGNALFFRDMKKGDKTFTPIMADITNDSYGVIDSVGDKFL